MAKKLNMVVVKGFFIQHGEKVALGACAFIAITFGIMGLMRAANAGKAEGTPLSSKSWPEAFKQTKSEIERARDGLQPSPMPKETEDKLQERAYAWNLHTTSYTPIPYLTQPDNTRADKRYNPAPLPVSSDSKLMRLDYLNCGIFVYDYDAANRTVNTLAPVEGDAANPMQPMATNPFGKKGEKGAPGAPGTAPTFAHDVRPTRMVVGTMVFPLKKLVADYTKALKFDSQQYLFASPDDLPHFSGFTLMRFEILPNGEYASQQGELIIGYDAKTKHVQVSAPLKKMLREAVYDDETPAKLEAYIFAGLTMPMPKLANRHYPKPVLAGIDLSGWDEEPQGDKKGMPGTKPAPKEPKGGAGVTLPGLPKKRLEGTNPGPAGEGMANQAAVVEHQIKKVNYKTLVRDDPHLANRLFNNKDFDKEFNYFHVFGFNPPEVPVGVNGAANPMMRPMATMPGPGGMGEGAMKDETRFFSAWTVPFGDDAAGPGEGPGPGPKAFRPAKMAGGEIGQPGPGGVEFKNWDRDALVRFVDVDVVPGKTYVYAIQVRIANPNYKKTTMVAFNALANNAELVLNQADSWTWTNEKPITIPHEYFLYAVDQQLVDDLAKGRVNKGALAKDRDAVPIQVHHWVKYKDDRASGTKHAIAEWAIAERLLVRRGEEIGLGAEVGLPIWRETKDAFEIPMELRNAKKQKAVRHGMAVDLRPVVMEKGGKEISLPAPVLVDFSGGRRYKTSGGVDEEAAVDVLVMDSFGKLVLRNSRVDSDSTYPMARDRSQRLRTVRARITEVYQESLVPMMKGPMTPGLPGVPNNN